jgi:hypothetical protein
MAFNVRKRGKLTYYYEGDRPVLSGWSPRNSRMATSRSISLV